MKRTRRPKRKAPGRNKRKKEQIELPPEDSGKSIGQEIEEMEKRKRGFILPDPASYR